MQITTSKEELRKILSARRGSSSCPPAFRTGWENLDRLAPGGAFQCGAIHELLWPPEFSSPQSFALLLAQAAQGRGGVILWSDPQRELHPAAVVGAGVDLKRFILLRCANPREELWAVGECLRCGGVGATVAAVEHLSLVAARRLQLAAEKGGGVGILLRPFTRTVAHYAAATRWLVRPEPFEKGRQRWSVQLLHGHGGHQHQEVLLEIDRETRAVHLSPPLADRPRLPATQRATA